MLQRYLGEHNIGNRSLFVITILFISVFGWFYITLPIMSKLIDNLGVNDYRLAIWGTFYLSIIVTSIICTFLSKRIDRQKYLYIWIVFGTAISFLPAILTNVDFWQVWSVSFLLGASFGLGMPSFLAYFADCTVVENRGRVAGITFLIANVSVALIGISSNTFSLVTISMIFAFLRAIGLIIFFQKPEKTALSKQITSNISFFSIVRDRSFLLYFVAWFMFPLIDKFESTLIIPYLERWNEQILTNMSIVEPLVATFSILIAGLLCDLIGRKKIVLSGFVAIGIAYCLIGLNPSSEIFWYMYYLVDAIAWGIFFLTFVLIIWGDLAQTQNSIKFYALGSIPFFLSSLIPEIVNVSIDVTSTFSIAGFFLFVAVLPLVFAPETLPEKKMELRRLRSFAEEAKKAKEKFERKK
jgi:MFS family permease